MRTVCIAMACALGAWSQPKDKEGAFGRQMAAEILRQYPALDDSDVDSYVNRLAGRIAAPAKTTVKAIVTDTAETALGAIPGGFLFVSNGVILRMESEAELAGVVAHGIAHIAARHGIRLADRTQPVTVPATPIIFAGGIQGACACASVAIPLGVMNQLTRFEEEADRLAAGYLKQAGFDAQGLFDGMKRMSCADAEVREGRERLRAELADQITQPGGILTSSEFDQVRHRLQTLKRPEPARAPPTLRRPPRHF